MRSLRNRLLILLLLVAVIGCEQTPQHTFTNELLLPMTPVKDQGKSELCWAYAMLATIETEHLLRGDSVNLSPQYLGRMLKNYSLSTHHSSLATQSCERAMCQTALNLLQRYGVVGFDVMPDDATDDLPTPKNVFLLGAKYTPLEFAHSVCAPDEYISLTSFPDSPYYKKIDVPIPAQACEQSSEEASPRLLGESWSRHGYCRCGSRRATPFLLCDEKLMGYRSTIRRIGLYANEDGVA